MPRVAVVIPTYNQAAFLKEALASVRAQTMADWEAIVVNNFSDDDTREVALSFADPRITLVDFANQGVIAASRNLGIARATAEWVAFLDSDDLWDPAKLESCLAAAADADLVSHPEHLLKDGRILGRTATADAARTGFAALLLDGNCLSPSAVLARKAVLDRAGGFCVDPEVVTAEDHDLWLRLARMGVRTAVVDRPLGSYRLHGAQNSKSVERHMAASLAVLARHYPALRPPAPLAYRRARARIVYSAGRTLQKAGRHRQALAAFARAAAQWPFMARLGVGAALSLAGLARGR